MKVLLISHYWYPNNSSGTFRWTNFSQFIDFDILTSYKPLFSFRDYSIRASKLFDGVYKFGYKMPAIIWGFIASFMALFKKYDVYIITSPPESLLIGAWVLQLFGKKVLVDMRDSIYREKQFYKSMSWIYKFFYKRLKNVIVAYKFIDETKEVVYSGYEDVPKVKFKGYYKDRLHRSWYLHKLSQGYMPDQSGKPTGYGSGSAQTYRYLGFPINNDLHKEVYEHKLQSIGESANKIKVILNNL